MKVDRFFATAPVFTTDEFRAYLVAAGSGNEATHNALLRYHLAQGNVIRVRRGLYAVVPSGLRRDEVSVDPFLVAAKLVPDSVVAYHSALELHGVASSVLHEIYYLTEHSSRPTEFAGLDYRAVAVPRALVERGAQMLGVTTVDRAGQSVRVTSLERTYVDVLDRLDLAGGWEEVVTSLGGLGYLDLRLVRDYCEALGNATTAAKAGLLLEHDRDSNGVDDATLAALAALAPSSPHYAFGSRGRAGRLMTRWNLVVPKELADRTWGDER